jgi:hypothetical protein
MDCDRTYDEDREEAMMEEARDREAAEIIAHYRDAHGLDVTVLMYTSVAIREIEFSHAELAKHSKLTPRKVADILSEHTGDDWVVEKTYTYTGGARVKLVKRS